MELCDWSIWNYVRNDGHLAYNGALKLTVVRVQAAVSYNQDRGVQKETASQHLIW